ncbi:MAG: transposase [Candidatus Omnitrophota bacterium]
MARTPRVVMDNTVYHIITRGNQKQKVFREPSDYQEYLKLLLKYKNKYRFKLYGFCLMPNHVHLLLEVDKGKILNNIMSGLNLSYTIYFNYKYGAVGHLWQGRFKSRIIAKDAYLLECLKYIENNSVRAFLVRRADEYQWSSNNLKNKIHGLIDELFSF